MIDYVRISKKIKIHHKSFSMLFWKESETEEGNPFLWYQRNGVKLRYYKNTENFVIAGKIIMLIFESQVLNLDDLFKGDTESFFDNINMKINGLFTAPTPIIDVRDFVVSRIDYCFNVKTPYVKEYIEFLSKAFMLVQSDNRIDYARKNELHGSVYIKTASDYENNSRQNYVLNFYDKEDWLTKQQNSDRRVYKGDEEAAKDVLRLEAQCGYQTIESICKKFAIDKKFGKLCNLEIAVYAIALVYKRVFRGTEEQDAYFGPTVRGFRLKRCKQFA